MPGLIKQNGIFDGLIIDGLIENGLIFDGYITELINTVAPVATGVGYNGQALTTTNGTWNVTPDSYTYQWYSDGSPIAGETSSSYTVDATTEGTPIYCEVTAIKSGYTNVTANSNTIHNFVSADMTTEASYDAADPSTIQHTGGAVSQWDDKSGNNYNVAQGTGSLQPTTGSFTLNGLNIIDFDQDALEVANFGNNVKSFVGVFVNDETINDTLAAQALWSTSDTVNNPLTGVFFGSATGALTDEVVAVLDEDTAFSFTDRQGISSTALPSIAVGGHIASISRGTGSWFMGVDGSGDLRDLTSGSRNDLNTGTTNIQVRLGSQFRDAVGYLVQFNGKIGELLYFATELSTADRQKVEGYLAHKWGLTANLPGGHPYKTSAPTP